MKPGWKILVLVLLSHRWMSRQCFQVQRIFWPNFSKFAGKTFRRKTFSQQNFCRCGYIPFSLTWGHWLENIKFETWNFVLVSTTEKNSLRWAVQECYQKPPGSVILSMPLNSEVWRSIHISGAAVSKEPHA